jgi:hypothetical protein
MIFYAFSKFQHFGNTIEDSVFRLGPWKFKIPYRKALGLRLDPQKDLGPCNVVLGVQPAAVRWNSSELVAGLGRRSSMGGPRGHTDAIWGRKKGRSSACERAPRHQAAAVAPSPPSARLELNLNHTRLEMLEWRRGRRLGASVRGGNGQRRRLHGGAALAGSVGATACARRHDERPFIARRGRCGSKPSS